MNLPKYVIGLDFGTDSVRSVIVDVDSGKEISTAVSYYSRWKKGLYSDPTKNQFRHHPADYTESLGAIKEAVKLAPKGTSDNIIGIGIDTTGSTPAPIDAGGTVLALKQDFKDDPDAMFVLWKDHTAVDEAELINKVARSWGGINYTKYSGGVYSSEWFFSKVLHIIKNNKKVRDATYSWVELAGWVPAILTGDIKPDDIRRGRCAAGHKAMWHPLWDGLPSEEFLTAVDPLLSGLRNKLYRDERYEKALEIAKEMEKYGSKVLVYKLDVLKRDDVINFFIAVKDMGKKLDIAINNALSIK